MVDFLLDLSSCELRRFSFDCGRVIVIKTIVTTSTDGSVDKNLPLIVNTHTYNQRFYL